MRADGYDLRVLVNSFELDPDASDLDDRSPLGRLGRRRRLRVLDEYPTLDDQALSDEEDNRSLSVQVS